MIPVRTLELLVFGSVITAKSPAPLRRKVTPVGSDDTDKVLTKMKASKVNDMYTQDGRIRGDGSIIRDMYLMQVKTTETSKEPWDYYNVVETIKGEAAWTMKAGSK